MRIFDAYCFKVWTKAAKNNSVLINLRNLNAYRDRRKKNTFLYFLSFPLPSQRGKGWFHFLLIPCWHVSTGWPTSTYPGKHSNVMDWPALKSLLMMYPLWNGYGSWQFCNSYAKITNIENRTEHINICKGMSGSRSIIFTSGPTSIILCSIILCFTKDSHICLQQMWLSFVKHKMICLCVIEKKTIKWVWNNM